MEKMKKCAKWGKGKTVMAFGTFDLLHLGHVHYLREARKLGNYLVVIVATDRNAEREKGRAPINSAEERAEMVRQLKFVDTVVAGEEEPEKMLEPVRRLKPDVIALGYDQKADEAELREKLRRLKLNPKIARIGPYKEEINKSSRLRGKLFSA